MTFNSIEINLERRLANLLQMVDEVVKATSESAPSTILKKPPTPTTQRRLLKANSAEKRESQSPARDPELLNQLLARLVTASEDVRQFQKNFGDERERERLRRASARRALSTDNGSSDNERSSSTTKLSKPPSNNGTLYRKSISFDQSVSGHQKIWKTKNDSASSIDSEVGNSHSLVYARDSSLDSRLSGGSTQSDLPRRRKKRGLMGKLKNLTRGSKASDNDGSVNNNAKPEASAFLTLTSSIPQQIDSGSDISLGNFDHKSSKSNLKERITDMFKRAPSAARQGSDDALDSDNRNASYSNKNTPVASRRLASPATTPRTSQPRLKRQANESK